MSRRTCSSTVTTNASNGELSMKLRDFDDNENVEDEEGGREVVEGVSCQMCGAGRCRTSG